jgi:hypothetical protein
VRVRARGDLTAVAQVQAQSAGARESARMFTCTDGQTSPRQVRESCSSARSLQPQRSQPIGTYAPGGGPAKHSHRSAQALST